MTAARTTARALAAALLVLSACSRAPAVEGSVRVLRRFEEATRGVVLPGCGCLLRNLGGPCFDTLGREVPVALPPWPTTLRALGAADVDGDGLEDLLETDPEGSLYLGLGEARCAFGPVTKIAGPRPGRGIRTFWTGRQWLVAWAENDVGPVRELTPPAAPGGPWGEAFPEIPEHPNFVSAGHPAGHPTFFAIEWGGARLYGIDTKGARTVPDEAFPEFWLGDPMDYGEIDVAGERRLWIATEGYVGNRLLAPRGGRLVDTTAETGAPLLTDAPIQYWGCHVHDFDGDGLSDVLQLAVEASTRAPRPPHVVLQLPGGRFADVGDQLRVDALFPSINAACLGPTCIVSDDRDRADLITVDVRRK